MLESFQLPLCRFFMRNLKDFMESEFNQSMPSMLIEIFPYRAVLIGKKLLWQFFFK